LFRYVRRQRRCLLLFQNHERVYVCLISNTWYFYIFIYCLGPKIIVICFNYISARILRVLIYIVIISYFHLLLLSQKGASLIILLFKPACRRFLYFHLCCCELLFLLYLPAIHLNNFHITYLESPIFLIIISAHIHICIHTSYFDHISNLIF